MPTSTTLTELDTHLNHWTTRLRLRDAVLWAARGLLGGLALGLGFSLIARLRPLYTVPTLITLSVVFALSGLLLALLLAWFWPRPRLARARYFDRVLGLQERTSMALELATSGAAPDWLKHDQWADAVRAARGADPKQRLPLRLARWDGWLCALVAAALALSLYLPNPQQNVLAHDQAVDSAIAEQIEKIEDAIEAIENNPNLTEDQKDALTEPLKDAVEQLKEGDLTQEQAVQVLTEAQDKLQEQVDQNAIDQANALENAGEGLSQNDTTKPVGDALQNGDLQSAADALSNIDLSKLSPSELAALADRLEKTAQELANTNPEVAKELQAAAEAIRAGDLQAAQEALDRAAANMSQTASDAANAQAASDAANAASDAQTAVAQAGGDGQQSNNGQGNQGNGQGNGQDGNGQGNQGNGQNGNGEGQGNQGNGSNGAGTGSGNGDNQGGEAGNGTDGTNGGANDGGETAYDPIYTPYHLGGSGGEDANLPGEGDPNGEVIGEGNTNPQNDGSVTVPYDEVYGYYNDFAREAIDNGEVPNDLRDVIRDYFSSLQPGR
jgi:hypothetical protein